MCAEHVTLQNYNSFYSLVIALCEHVTLQNYNNFCSLVIALCVQNI